MNDELTSRVVYDNEQDLPLTLFRAVGRQAPVVLSLQSGFEGLSREGRARRFAAHGVTIASVTVRDPGVVGYSESVADVQRAATYLLSHAETLGLHALATSRRIGLTGVSLGGWLAALVALTPPGSSGQPSIAAVNPWSAPSDLWTGSRRSALEARVFAPPRIEEQIVPGLDPDTLRAASPIGRPLASAPPFLLVHGDRDIIVPFDQSRWLHEALQRSGSESALMAIGNAGHDDDRLDEDAVIGAIAAWFLMRMS